MPWQKVMTYYQGNSVTNFKLVSTSRILIRISTRWYWDFACLILYLSDSTSRTSILQYLPIAATIVTEIVTTGILRR